MSIAKLSEISGLQPDDIKSIAEQVKKNHAALNGCSGHAFADISPEKTYGKRYRCAHCGGEVDFHAHHWYDLGRKHAGNK